MKIAEMKSASHLVEAHLTADGIRNLLTRHDLAVIGFITSNAPASKQKHGMNSNPYSRTTQLNTVKQMIYMYIAVLCNPKITAEPLYNTLLFIGPYAAANNTALLA